MKINNLTQREPKAFELHLEAISLEVPIQVAMLIAIHYGCNTRDCLMPGYGQSDFSTTLLNGADVWYASGRDQMRVWSADHREGWITEDMDPVAYGQGEKVAGVTVTRAVNQKNGGETQEVWWFPFESLAAVELMARGVRIK